jgi:hypothetical protein
MVMAILKSPKRRDRPEMTAGASNHHLMQGQGEEKAARERTALHYGRLSRAEAPQQSDPGGQIP